jgi:hypothetical protein
MSEYQTDQILGLFAAVDKLVPQAVFSGSLGDAGHTYGYHRARAVLPASDYSCRYALDRQGDSWAASALDISFPPDLMKTVSARLMAACKADDPRVAALREWFGTVDGTHVTGWDRAAGGYTSSDDSHLWHLHLSFFRKYATDAAALAPIADVIAGVARQEDDVLSDADIEKIATRTAEKVWGFMLDRVDYDGVSGRHTAGWRVLDAELNARAAATGGPVPAPHPKPTAK